ncbi:hypothetical protein ACFQ2H_02500 [Streptomyces violaceoruber]
MVRDTGVPVVTDASPRHRAGRAGWRGPGADRRLRPGADVRLRREPATDSDVLAVRSAYWLDAVCRKRGST